MLSMVLNQVPYFHIFSLIPGFLANCFKGSEKEAMLDLKRKTRGETITGVLERLPESEREKDFYNRQSQANIFPSCSLSLREAVGESVSARYKFMGTAF